MTRILQEGAAEEGGGGEKKNGGERKLPAVGKG
jgi:hypothetical protein